MREETLFAEALAHTDPAARSAFLEQACGGDAALRQRIEALLRFEAQLRSHERACNLPEQPTVDTLATSDVTPGQWLDAQALLPSFPLEGVGSRIGPYKLLQQIGEGGMGSVFMAEQQEPVRRMVALKLIKAGMDSAQVIARFEAERQALALMDHPNIAKVLDAGTTASGRPYFVMELVKGIPITKYCDEHRLTLRQRLELFVPVCQALQHAHQKGIIHRDIKPSNVLIAVYDGKPVPKVIDFGVAKAMGQKLTEHTLSTGLGSIVGTLEYMSPEQAELNAVDIDTRSDIYSLGVLLYELLTGTTPLTRQRVKEAAILEVLRLIREHEPPRPSTRLSELGRSGEPSRTGSAARLAAPTPSLASVSAQRHLEPAALVKALRGEVDWIVMKALDKDRKRRYDTANSLAQDIQRYLAEEPVEAGPPSTTYRLRKLAWKYRRGLATAAALVLLLVVSAVASTTLAVWALRAEKEARTAEQAAVADRNRAVAAEEKATEQRDKAVAAEKAAKQSEEDTNAVLAFFQNQVLAADRPEGQEGGKGKDVKLREAVDASESAIGKSFADRPLVEASIRTTLGTTYWYLGDYPRGIQQLEQAVALHEAKLGLDHPNTLDSRYNLACAYREAGRAEDAIRLHERNLKLHEVKYGADHPETLFVRDGLALAYWSANRFAESIGLQEQTLQQREAKLGTDHPLTLISRSNLGLAYLDTGRTADAIRLFEQTLKQAEAKLGTENPTTLIYRNNLADAYLDADRIDEAIRLHEQTLQQREAKLGTEHPLTLASRSNLAKSYDRGGQFVKAEALYRVVIDQTRKRFGPEDARTTQRTASLGLNLLHQHKYADAELLLRDCLKVCQTKQPDDWRTFNTRALLGEALLGQKKYTDAESLLLSGYQGMKQRQAKIPTHSKVRLSEALERLVQLYEATGKKDQADQWRKELEQARKASAADAAKN